MDIILCFLCGLTIACPFGAMFVLSVRQILSGNKIETLKIIGGCATADTIYFTVVLYGQQTLFLSLSHQSPIILMSGVTALVLLIGSILICKRPQPLQYGFLMGFSSNLVQIKTVAMITGFMLATNLDLSTLPSAPAVLAYWIGDITAWLFVVLIGAGACLCYKHWYTQLVVLQK